MKRIHYYHGDGSTFGGHIKSPVEKIVPSQAEVALPSTGGFTSRKAGEFNFEEILSCKSSYTHASGSVSHKTGGFTTLVTSAVEGLNILEVVTADRVVAQISVEHPAEGYTPKVTFVGSQFVNLRIGGFPVQPAINLNLLTPGDDYPETPWLQNGSFIDAVRQQNRRTSEASEVPEWMTDRYGWVHSDQEIEKRGFVLCSLVDSIGGVFPGKSTGHTVEIPEFGKFFFGEVLIDHGSFRLTMVRAELGCAVDGEVDIGSGGTNGHTYP